MKQKILVLAIRKFKGEVDSNKHDFTKITYVPFEPNSIDTDTEKGNYSKELVYGTSEEFDKLSNHSYPSIFEADLEVIPGRKGYQVNLTNLEYISNLEVI